jgi:sulfur carrier protein ThiS
VRVSIKLMGVLKSKTSGDGVLELAEQATIQDALEVLNIPVESVQVFTVNGRLVRDRAHVLQENDELSMLPPVGGG